MKVFNRQNDLQFTEQEEGYTQGIGISWQVNFDNSKELFEKMGFKKNNKIITIKKDSIYRKQSFIFDEIKVKKSMLKK